jgi:CheY-like chemotaxis protein/Tfp pilus assembly protein PilF
MPGDLQIGQEQPLSNFTTLTGQGKEAVVAQNGVSRGNDEMINYTALRALVVDDYPGMRSALKLTLSNFGVTKIQMAGSAAEAIARIQNNIFDFILCDFNLGEGRDGQQLLEELRHRGLISLETVFIMVTAESIYEKVAATAELAPDDYMIKPFSAEVLRNRLESILLRKLAFKEVYRHYNEHDLVAALHACDRLIDSKPKYLIDALRFKGELLNAMGRFEEAEALYRRIITMRAIPWARLGLASALHRQKKDVEAEEELRDVLVHAPEMVAAYDMLANVCLARNDSAGAQAVLEQGVAISGKTVRRQQKLGEIAHANGDLESARKAYATALEKGRNSVFVTPTDYGNLCQVQLEQGDLKAVAETLKNSRNILQASADGQLVMAVVQGVAQQQAGKPEEAEKFLREADRLRSDGASADAPLLLKMAETWMAGGQLDAADSLINEVARNAHDSETLMEKAKQIYLAAGREDAGVSNLKAATADVRKLNNEGVLLAQKGEYRQSVEKLLAACHEAPRNPRIIMNAVWVVLKCIDLEGMDEELLDQARRYLDEANRQAPGHSRIAGLRLHMKEIENKFGIRRRSAT